MLELEMDMLEYFDEEKSEFIYVPPMTVKLEHSLLSISKWESRTHKRFLDETAKTSDEMIEYVKCMTINKDVPDIAYPAIYQMYGSEIREYIEDSMSATTFKNRSDNRRRKTGEAISSELVYYWMTAFNIPFECEKWHFNRLMTLINICSIKNEPPKKMSKGSVMKQNSALNAARRKMHHSRG